MSIFSTITHSCQCNRGGDDAFCVQALGHTHPP